MFETAGTTTHAEVTSSLVVVLLLPLVWTLVAGVAAVRKGAPTFAVRFVLATSAGAFLAAIAHAVWTTRVPLARQHVATFVRLGQLDLSLDLVRSPTSVACAVVVTLVGFGAVLHALLTAPAALTGRLAWTGSATTAALLVVLSDGMGPLLVGLQAATFSAWALSGGGKTVTLALAIVGDTLAFCAMALVFWSLSGSFAASGFVQEPLPRFALVALPDAPRADLNATLALRTYDGARVTSDEGDPLVGEPLVAPFEHVLAPAMHSLRVHVGAGAADTIVSQVTFAAGRAYELVPFGPTMSALNLQDQLGAPRPTGTGSVGVRTLLASRTLAGIRITTFVAVLVALSVLLRLLLLATSMRGGIVYGMEIVASFVVAARFFPLFDAPIAAGCAVLAGVASALFALSAASSTSSDRVPRTLLASLSSLAVALVFLDEQGAAFVVVASASLGTAALTAALDSEADVRWLGVACGSMGGLLPGVGLSPGMAMAFSGAFAARAGGTKIAEVVAPLFALVAILLSLATMRLYFAGKRVLVSSSPPRGSGALVVALCLASVLVGAALGVGTSRFGGSLVYYAHFIVGETDRALGPRNVGVASLGLAMGGAILGAFAAAHATATVSRPRWLAALEAGSQPLVRGARGVAQIVRYAVRSTRVMNEDILEDMSDVITVGVAPFARAGQRAHTVVVAVVLLALAVVVVGGLVLG